MNDDPTSGRNGESHPIWGPFFFWTLLHARRSVGKRLVALCIVMLLAASIQGKWLSVDQLTSMARFFLTLGLPLLALVYGSGVIREEIEQQTLTYSLTRPIPRQMLYASRILAAALPLSLAILPSLVVFAWHSDWRLNAPLLMGGTLMGGFAFVALFALVGQFSKRPIGIGVVFLVWEAGVSRVPGVLGEFTLTRHLSTVAGLPLDLVLAQTHQAVGWLVSACVLSGATVGLLALGAQLMAKRGFTIPR